MYTTDGRRTFYDPSLEEDIVTGKTWKEQQFLKKTRMGFKWVDIPGGQKKMGTYVVR